VRRAALLALLAALAAAAPAAAHPLGNFSLNHLSRVSVSADRVDVTWILDQAEIPTFQERGTAPAAVLARKRREAVRGLELTVDGRRVRLRPLGPGRIWHPPGQGGLPLTRVVLALRTDLRHPRRVELHDGTFPGRVGWKAVVARPGTGTAVTSSAPSGDPTHGLRTYPASQLQSPLDERTARLTVRPGDGTLTAPEAPGAAARTTTDRSGDGFAGVLERAAAGRGVLVVFLLAAFAWGAIHALSPGHGKAMVAAYLVGRRGTARHALALGATVTATHTAGVFALGLVTLLLSAWVLPEDLYPWLNLLSGLMVVVVGVAALRSRIRWGRAHRAAHAHDRAHDHAHAHDHDHDHDHDHGHDHHPPERITARGIVAMGASAGIIPCPSALVVLLGAIAQHQVALGLVLIVAFSLGLAATLTALGLVVVGAGRITARLPLPPNAAAALPALSTLLILGLGLTLTVRAVGQLV
jgi:ABC-type nickel/cobalt efflux system permease component RcnA